MNLKEGKETSLTTQGVRVLKQSEEVSLDLSALSIS